MEVTVHEKGTLCQIRSQRSSFDCDSSTIDGILGLTSVGQAKLRLDSPHLPLRPRSSIQYAQVYAPLDVVPAMRNNGESSGLETDSMQAQTRLLRLLDQQQSWYDAQQQAALAAEQLLSLCEHHQQQCLHLNLQTQQALPQSIAY